MGERERGSGKKMKRGGEKTTATDKSVKARVKAAAEERMEEKGTKIGRLEGKKTNTLIGLSRSN